MEGNLNVDRFESDLVLNSFLQDIAYFFFVLILFYWIHIL